MGLLSELVRLRRPYGPGTAHAKMTVLLRSSCSLKLYPPPLCKNLGRSGGLLVHVDRALVRESLEAEVAVVAAHPAAVDPAEREPVLEVVREHAVDGHAARRGPVEHLLHIGLVVAVDVE